jgi:DDE superfamily endonuclease
LLTLENNNSKNKLQVQLVCDHKKMIRQYVIGYPGSCHDSRIWNECNLSKTPEKFFSNEQWIAGDKGYPLRKNLLTPMKESYKKVRPDQKKKFNKYFSKYRVVIEHVNGALKETFESLKGLRVKITNKAGHEEAVRWIRSCLILYNITQPFDNWTPVDIEDSSDYTGDEGNDYISEDFSAEDKRLALLNFVLCKLEEES